MAAEGGARGTTVPFVSVIMPVRDEGGRHVRAIRSMLDQRYPRDRMELIVVVGRSRDDTLPLARALAEADERVTVIPNPAGTTPASLNLGLRRARGEVVGRLDGHAWAAPDFLAQAVAALARSGADGVGGIAEHVGQGRMGTAIAIAMSSPAGSGNASFRVGGREGPADTVVFGMYRAEVFDRVGAFDEELLRNQDDEMNHRIRRAGGLLHFTPGIRSSYVVRGRLRHLWRQYEAYGAFRVATLVKHRRPGAARQLAAPLLVLALTAAAGAEAASGRPTGRAGAGAYLGLVAGAGLLSARRAGRPALAPVVSAALATMHLAYGTGFWREAARRLVRLNRGRGTRPA